MVTVELARVVEEAREGHHYASGLVWQHGLALQASEALEEEGQQAFLQDEIVVVEVALSAEEAVVA